MVSQQDGLISQDNPDRQGAESAPGTNEVELTKNKDLSGVAVSGDVPITELLRARLRHFMEARGFSRSKLSAEAGLGPTYVADALSGKSKVLGIDSLKKLADALRIQLTMLLEVDAPYPQEFSRQSQPPRKVGPHRYVKVSNRLQTVRVTYVAETGVVRIGGHIILNRREIAFAPYDRFPSAKIAAVEARDWAMDRATSPIALGYYAAIAHFDGDFRPEVGMIVLVRLKHHDGPEMILRRLQMRDGHYILAAESSEPALYPQITVKTLSTDPTADISFVGKVFQIIGFPDDA